MTEPLIPLKPCPFCGATPTQQYGWIYPVCDCVPEGEIQAGTWNTRPLEAQLLETLKYIANEDVDPWITQICATAIAAAEGRTE
jgi:hypothetical protein